MTFRGVFAAFVAVLFVSGVVQSVSAQQQYTVNANGGGWVLQPSNGPSGTFYDDQFTNTQLVVGDVLLFPFTAPNHNVYMVTQAAFTACSTSNPLLTNLSSDATMTLNATGPNYFICAVPGHCGQGMHLAVNVLASATPPAATPTAPPTTSPVTAPTPPPARVPAPVPSTTPTPPPVSAPTPAAGGPTPASPTPATPTPASSTAPSTAPAGTPTSPSTGGEGPAEGPGAPGPGSGDQGSSASGLKAVPAIVVATLLAACSALVF